MSPKSTLTETEVEGNQQQTKPVQRQIVWRNAILFALLNLAAFYGLYLAFASAMWQTNVFAYFLYVISGLGITAGCHRLWSHRTYKAKLPLRILLGVFNTIAFQNSIFDWSRDHRVHHKYSETDADPHNAKRGFFFSHVGWLMLKKHPDVLTKGKTVDLSDLLNDPVVAFQKKYYVPLMVIGCFVMPTIVPPLLWGETYYNAFYVPCLLRYCILLHCTWLVNSAAHMFGNRPYDKTINPRENIFVVLGAIGEGFHNYHHTFPWDYATSEYGMKLNLTATFIRFMATLGLAYDLRTATPDMIERRKLRTGEDHHLH